MSRGTLRLASRRAALAGLLGTVLVVQSVRGQQPTAAMVNGQPPAQPAAFDYPSFPTPPAPQTPGLYPYPTAQSSDGYFPPTGQGGPAGGYGGQAGGYGGQAGGYGGQAGGYGGQADGYGGQAGGYGGAAPPGGGGAADAFGSAFTAGAFGAGGGGTVAVADNGMNYIDSAIIRTRFRQRYDSAYDLNSPDKAEFFYAKCGCFSNPENFKVNGVFNKPFALAHGYDIKARGPQHQVVGVPGTFLNGFSKHFGGENQINFQELSSYFEYAATRRFSTFIEVPVRFLNPSLVRNFYGFSDINAGFKYALVAEPNRFYTFQLRGYVPTGASDKGLGTGHTTLEPSFLVFQRLTERLFFNGELRDWIPINGSDYAGNIIRYGTGLAYNVVLTDHFRIAPVNEVVGWSLLGGKETVAPPHGNAMGNVSVGGQTIVNELVGLRFGAGNYNAPGGGSGLNDRHTLGLSYGQCITGDHWYKHIILAEYNFWF